MNPFPFPALLRRDTVLQLTGFSSDDLDREIERGLFPPPVKLTPDDTSDAVGWNSCELACINAAKIRGAGLDETRKLVTDLLLARGLLASTQSGRVAIQPDSKGVH